MTVSTLQASAATTENAKFDDLLTPEQKESFRQLSPFRTWLALIGIWGVMAATVYLVYLWPHPLAFALAAVVIGSRQFALAVLMHEAAHGLLLPSRYFNQFICQWFCAFPIMQDVRPYRPYHAAHHQYTETDKDPDLAFSRAWPASRASLMRKIARDLTGIAGVRRHWQTFRAVSGSPDWPWYRRLRSLLNKLSGFFLTNSLLFACFAILTHWSFYFLLWWLPMLTWYSLIYRIRNIAEHALVPATSEFNVARTTLPPLWYRWTIAPLNVGYHAEHHLMSNCPWYQLPSLHVALNRALREKNCEQVMCTAPTYWAVLRLVVAPTA